MPPISSFQVLIMRERDKVPPLFYLVEGYRRLEGRVLEDRPVKVQAVTIQQLAGAIAHLLTIADIVQVEAISEDAFRQFYVDKSKERKTK
jgi:hypothetical protein